MANRKLNFLVALVIAFSCLFTACKPFKKQSYEDCILENMKGVKSDDAANQIKMACELKMYSDNYSTSSSTEKCEIRLLSDAELKNVSGKAKLESYGFLKVKVYNGNTSIKIKDIKVKITDLENQKQFDFQLTNSEVDPISTSGEMLAELLYAPKKWNWYMYDITTEICK
jgi:hypothetical protein